MAVIHTEADLRPEKLELLATWVPQQAWGSGDHLERVATFRFDDPDGEVGMETFLLSAGSALLHVPLTYRGSPLADGALVGEMEHSVLGRRWVYDAVTDPVYIRTVAQVIVEGGQEAVLRLPDGTQLAPPGSSASVRGSGVAGGGSGGRIRVLRRPLAQDPVPNAQGVLSATWGGHAEPVPLVLLEP